MPTDILRHWFTRQQLSHIGNIGTSYSTRSCFATALWFNLGQLMAGGLKPPLSAMNKELLQGQLDTIGDNSPGVCNVKTEARRGTATLLDHHFAMKASSPRQTRIIAIVDNECSSDCEGMVIILSQLPDTVMQARAPAARLASSSPA